MRSRKGIGTRAVKPRSSFTAVIDEAYDTGTPWTAPKKSGTGTLTDGS